MVNKLKKWILPLLAAAMLLTAALPSALAYFTTYTRAKGGYTIRLGSTTTIDEEVTGTQKILVISNTEGADVFVTEGQGKAERQIRYAEKGYGLFRKL